MFSTVWVDFSYTDSTFTAFHIYRIPHLLYSTFAAFHIYISPHLQHSIFTVVHIYSIPYLQYSTFTAFHIYTPFQIFTAFLIYSISYSKPSTFTAFHICSIQYLQHSTVPILLHTVIFFVFKVRVFSFLIGREVKENRYAKWMACVNKGMHGLLLGLFYKSVVVYCNVFM